jgi:hypothetical protein
MADVQLTISLDDFDHARVLDAWKWLMPADFKPFLLTAFGDWILGAPDGAIYLMDTLEGQLTRIAETGREYNDCVDNDQDKRDSWLYEGLVIGQASRGVFLEKGECFGWIIPPIIGGSFEADNIKPHNIVAYETVVGALHQQIRDLPPGSTVSRFTVDGKDPDHD